MVWRLYQNIVRTWIARSLSATGSSGTFAAGLMTHFPSLSFSGGGGVSMQGTGSALAQWARGSLGDNNLGYSVFLCRDSRCFVCFPSEEHLFPKVEGRRSRIFSLSINPTF
jgi:hypothetical protein